jgi:hypothetical protein
VGEDIAGAVVGEDTDGTGVTATGAGGVLGVSDCFSLQALKKNKAKPVSKNRMDFVPFISFPLF